MKRIMIVTFLLLSGVAAYGADILVSPGDVTDSRTTGKFFAKLEVKLKVMGDMIADAKGLKVKITRAVDDTGRNLIKDAQDSKDFTKPDDQGGQAELTVELKNPSRKASVIRELSGEVTVYAPGNDPKATATIRKFMTMTGKPLSDPGLSAAQVEITVMTKEQFEKIKAAQEKEVKDQASKEFGQAIAQAFGSLFGGFMDVNENSVILSVKDPQSRVVGIEFFTETGEQVRNNGSMSMGSERVYQFDRPMPENARMLIFLITPKALIKAPVTLRDIALP